MGIESSRETTIELDRVVYFQSPDGQAEYQTIRQEKQEYNCMVYCAERWAS